MLSKHYSTLGTHQKMMLFALGLLAVVHWFEVVNHFVTTQLSNFLQFNHG